MNPHYLWLTEGLELLTFFVLGPALGLLIAYKVWREKKRPANPKRYGMWCIVSGVAALILFALAKRIDADVRTPQYFLQLACLLLSLLSFGACQGFLFSVLLDMWRWHRKTRSN
jgi:hypothetical protein